MRKIYLVLIAALLMTALACEKELLLSQSVEDQPVTKTAKLGKNGNNVTVPIKFVGYTAIGENSGFDPGTCGGEFCFLNFQNGKGNASHMGEVDISFTFCVRVPQGCDQDYPGFPILYNQNTGVIEAANGDKLYLEGDGDGALYPTDKPGYAIEFKDKINIVGGTGRFEDASGYFITDSYNRGDTTDHVLTGMLNYSK